MLWITFYQNMTAKKNEIEVVEEKSFSVFKTRYLISYLG